MKTCYYELLGVAQNATNDELKKKFKALMRYDGHRESILRGDDELSDEEDEYSQSGGNYVRRTLSTEHLMRFFSGAFNGYSNNTGGFYEVYGALFRKIEEEETSAWNFDTECLKTDHAPDLDFVDFGRSDTPYDDDVKLFYAKFMNFSSCKSFRWMDKHKLSEAPDRYYKRVMERENLKERENSRKTFSETVRRLATFIQKRDPRFIKYQEHLRANRVRKELQEKERIRQDRRDRLEKVKDYQEQEWSKPIASIDDIMDGFADEFEDAVEVQDELFCAACKKVFKTDKQWQNHERSKKHLKNVEMLRQQLLEEEDEFSFDTASVTENIEGTEDSFDGDDDAELGELNDDDDGEESVNDIESPQTQDPDIDDENVEPEIESEPEIIQPRLKRKEKKKKQRFVLQQSDDDDDDNDEGERQDVAVAESVTNGVEKLETIEALTASVEERESPKSNPAISKKTQKKANKASASSDELSCAVCNAKFTSRNKLFDHIKESGHATAPSSKDRLD
ncbi:DnaJ sub C member 21 [Phlyctochytrium planicorne]|nr:DnaJ sub C member 21 [Phlyctochytrium planicorne]